MTDPRQNVIPGQRLQIAASQINALNAMMRPSFALDGAPENATAWASNIILVKNTTSQPVPRFGVLSLGNPDVTPTNEKHAQFAADMVLVGGVPSGGSQNVGIAVEPIPAGKIGRMAIGGRFACKVKVLSDTHGYARGRANDVTQLISAECGPIRLLWKQGTGNDQFAAGMI